MDHRTPRALDRTTTLGPDAPAAEASLDAPDPVEAGPRGPKITVITVVYNDRDGFSRTAHSVLEQAGADWEWVVIDGGSTDGTRELVMAHADRTSFWCSERDGGIYDAMNKGLARANGEFVVFMNAGDRFAGPDSLKRVAEAIRRAGPGAGMVLGAARFELTPDYSYVQAPRPLDPYVLHSLPTSHQAMYFRTELHRRAPFDTRVRIAADYDAICRMYRINPEAAYVPEVVAVVWRGLESNSIRHPFANMRDMAATQRRVLRLGRARVLASMAKRALPVFAFRLMSHRWSAPLTARLVTALRPEPSGAEGGRG